MTLALDLSAQDLPQLLNAIRRYARSLARVRERERGRKPTEPWVLPSTDGLIADGTTGVIVASEHVLANQPQILKTRDHVGSLSEPWGAGDADGSVANSAWLTAVM